jgi:hypothetical protein
VTKLAGIAQRSINCVRPFQFAVMVASREFDEPLPLKISATVMDEDILADVNQELSSDPEDRHTGPKWRIENTVFYYIGT